jgi:hypothetical protein
MWDFNCSTLAMVQNEVFSATLLVPCVVIFFHFMEKELTFSSGSSTSFEMVGKMR